MILAVSLAKVSGWRTNQVLISRRKVSSFLMFPSNLVGAGSFNFPDPRSRRVLRFRCPRLCGCRRGPPLSSPELGSSPGSSPNGMSRAGVGSDLLVPRVEVLCCPLLDPCWFSMASRVSILLIVNCLVSSSIWVWRSSTVGVFCFLLAWVFEDVGIPSSA